MSNTSSATLMTEGSIWKRIVLFAIPLFWGNLFQQLYNAADSLIVGNFLGNNSLAAVSSSGHLIFLMIGFFNGIGIGAGVVIARYFGAGDTKNVRKAIHNAIGFGLICGVVMTIGAELTAPLLLKAMGTPVEILPESLAYFRIYFAGSIGFIMYNFLQGILQALGDSKSPLIYLIISSVLNVILDLVFIEGLGLGVESAALATLISQCLSAILCVRQLMHAPEAYRVSLKEIRLEKSMLKQIVSNGIPAGIQNSIIAVANVFVQSQINQFGALAVAGCGSYMKIEGFAFLPVTCFSQTLTTFVSQNLGAGKGKRAKQGAIFGTICSMVMAEIIGILIFVFSPYLVGMFGADAGAVQFGVTQAKTVSLFYCMLAFSHCMAAIQRGAGKSIVPMFVMMIAWCGIRITYIATVIHFWPVIGVVYWAYPITWTISSVIFLFLFFRIEWVKKNEK